MNFQLDKKIDERILECPSLIHFGCIFLVWVQSSNFYLKVASENEYLDQFMAFPERLDLYRIASLIASFLFTCLRISGSFEDLTTNHCKHCALGK